MDPKRNFAPVAAAALKVNPDVTDAQRAGIWCLLDPVGYHICADDPCNDAQELVAYWSAIDSKMHFRVRQMAARGRVSGVLVGFSREERRGVLRAAKAVGLSLPEYVRRAALVCADVPFAAKPGPVPAVPVPSPEELKPFLIEVLLSLPSRAKPKNTLVSPSRAYGNAVAGAWYILTGRRPPTSPLVRNDTSAPLTPYATFAQAAFDYGGMANWTDNARAGAREFKRLLPDVPVISGKRKSKLTPSEKKTPCK
jgi:hypothetical protein